MSAKNISKAGLIASLYIVLTFITNMFGLANGAIQIRISEALTILPAIMPTAIPGVTIGCLISNIITGCTPVDIVFGTLATLIGAIGTYVLRNNKYLAVIPPIVANTIIVPVVLMYSTGTQLNFWFCAFTVCIGEIISCAILGLFLLKQIEKRNII